MVEVDKHGVTYDIQCHGEEKLKKTHYKQLKPWHGRWPREKVKKNSSKIEEAKEMVNSYIIMAQQQLWSPFSFGELPQYSPANDMIMTTEQSLHNLPQWDGSKARTVWAGAAEHGGPLPLSGTPEFRLPQQTPTSASSPVEENSINEFSLSPPQNVRHQDRSGQREALSPQMQTRSIRRARLLGTEGPFQDYTFLGFDEALDTSVPERLDILKSILNSKVGAPNRSSEDVKEIVLNSRNPETNCSTCGKILSNHEDCSGSSSLEQ